MHQDDLWRTSARPTAFTFRFVTADALLAEQSQISVGPTWSKKPTGTDGSSTFKVETFTEWHLHEVFKASFHQFLAGQGANVGRAARAAYRDVHNGFVLGTHG